MLLGVLLLRPCLLTLELQEFQISDTHDITGLTVNPGSDSTFFSYVDLGKLWLLGLFHIRRGAHSLKHGQHLRQKDTCSTRGEIFLVLNDLLLTR